MDHPELAVPSAPAWTRPAVMLPIFAFLSLLGGLLPSFSLEANVYVFTLGAVMMYLGLSQRVPRKAAPRRLPRGLAWWLLPVGVFVVFELSTFAIGDDKNYPTLSLLADPLLDDYLPRAIFYFGWLAGFWGLVRR
ncbi:MAG: hypothetical protein HOV71_08325 [Hamadaea sp.]|uniref:hypothetical protein n=1 Tax=Hamadaea sp. NPDC050747 TaxID=3155789 RepID=UPI0017E19E9C|nr:hypothetical protein [Hamadaea sp.]NUR48122.1 hypothetical protein [Hamadaea sp.]NUT06060.1 hypothetical protein [Hamadaea sp.]